MNRYTVAAFVSQPRYFLSLHEGGHIAHGDTNSGNAFDDASGGGGKFNLDATAQKDRENAADRFAADAIASGIQDKGSGGGLGAARLSMGLAQLSWNLAEHRLLDNFGGTEANLSSLFQDAGLSHPNLEWRILVVNEAISHSSTPQQLLSDGVATAFQALRQAAQLVLRR